MAGSAVDFALEEAIVAALEQLDDEQQEHFKTLCGALLSAYIDDSMHALLLLAKEHPPSTGRDNVEVVQIMAVNATDIHAAQIVGGAVEKIGTFVMADAPPRNLFN